MTEDFEGFLRKRLGGEPRADVLEYLKSQGRFRPGEKDELLEEYRRLDSHFQGSGKQMKPTVVEIPADARADALGRILAIDAERRDDVKEFRQKFLNDRLLMEHEVSEWLERTAQSHYVDEVKTGAKARRRPTYLEYLQGSSANVVSVGVIPGTPLARLKKLVSALEKAYPAWRGIEAHIVQLVLASTPPPTTLARLVVEPVEPFSAQSRILITIDPRVSPKVLAEKYSEVRRQLNGKGPPRDKAITDKHLELSIPAEEKRHADGPGWEELLASWNSRFPQWEYTGVNAHINFARDARSAWTRITGDAWPSR